MSANEFLDRVMPHVAELSQERFSHTSWRFEGRPTSEGVGLMPHPDTDVDVMVAHILDVEAYPDNVKFVESIDIVERRSETDVTYVQRMNLPLIGRIQVQIHLSDYGERDGYRVVAWDQDDDATAALDKKRGARTAYNLGAWLLREDAVGYALASAPLKKDVGTLKYLAMTKGADATAGEVLRQNIHAMIEWAHRG
ncbi:MAG: hypothetical protein R2720_04955 [Candidatus Nanopelagicales bacterium]